MKACNLILSVVHSFFGTLTFKQWLAAIYIAIHFHIFLYFLLLIWLFFFFLLPRNTFIRDSLPLKFDRSRKKWRKRTHSIFFSRDTILLLRNRFFFTFKWFYFKMEEKRNFVFLFFWIQFVCQEFLSNKQFHLDNCLYFFPPSFKWSSLSQFTSSLWRIHAVSFAWYGWLHLNIIINNEYDYDNDT